MSEPRRPATAERVDDASARLAVAATRWTSPVADLYALEGPEGEPLVFDRTIADAAPEALARLADALEGLDAETLRALPEPGRVALQNDLWGVAARRSAAIRTTPDGGRLDAALVRLLRELALPSTAVIFAEPAEEPPELLAALPPAEGWAPVASDMPALQHEQAFGERRLFRLFQRRGGEDMAMVSHLLAIDVDGIVRRAAVVGEVELLRIAGEEVVGAEVFESELGPDGAPSLRPVAALAQLPSRGADEPFAEFDPPAPLADLPCLRCHHDGDAMSLPNPSLDPGWREPGVLRRAQRSASALLDRAPLMAP